MIQYKGPIQFRNKINSWWWGDRDKKWVVSATKLQPVIACACDFGTLPLLA